MGGNSLIAYVFYYTGGKQQVRFFKDEEAFQFFKHMEGDHLLDTKRFYPDEQDEADYNHDP
jgi:hypothetical protein